MKKQMMAFTMAALMVLAAGCAKPQPAATEAPASAAPETTAAAAETTAASAGSTAAAAETTTAAETTAESKAQTDVTGKEFKVGIVQFMDHPSLNQIEQNVMKELDALSAEYGCTFNYKDFTFNGQGDSTVLNQIASQLIDDKVDVIVPIATPSAQVMQAACEDLDIPIVFSAVSDPVTAGLTDAMDVPGGKITGTSDYLNTNALMDLIFAANPDADYIGLLYSKSEDASRVPIEDAKAYLDGKGVKYIEKTGTTTDEVSQAVEALVAEGVDAVFTPTDNTIQNAELAIYEKLAEAQIPHYAGADSFALNGAFCGYGVDYANLGTATADMVAMILVDGADPAVLPVETFDNGIATVNTETCQAMGFDLDAIKEAFAPFCTKIEEIETEQEFAN